MNFEKEMTFFRKYLSVHSLILLSIILVAIGFRFINLTNSECDYYHFDEQLVSNISKNIYEKKTYDNNWIKHFEDPESFFHVNQYNFSSYIYFSAFIYSSWRNLSERFNSSLWDYKRNVHFHRIVSATLNLIAILLIYWICFECFGQKEIALIGLFLCSFSPLLVQDSHYARPEGFLTLIAVLALLLTIKTKSLNSPLLYLSFFLIGISISCKISMVVLFSLPIIQLFKILKQTKNRSEISLRTLWPIIFKSIISLTVGILIGMPYVLINFSSYIEGINLLSEQYSRIYPPYSLYDGSRLLLAVPSYFIQVYGYLFWISYIYGNYKLIMSKRSHLFLILNIGFIVFITVFSFNRALFERNFTPFLPYISIIVAFGIFHIIYDVHKILTLGIFKIIVPILFAGALVFVPLSISYRLVIIEMSCAEGLRKYNFEKELLKKYNNLPMIEDDLMDLSLLDKLDSITDVRPQLVLKLYDFNDDFTKHNIPLLKQKYRIIKIGQYSSIFPDIRACTLHTYHSPTIQYFVVSHPILRKKIN
jgi:hypothetical protein